MKIRLNNHLNGFFFNSKMHTTRKLAAICEMNVDYLIIISYFCVKKESFLLKL